MNISRHVVLVGAAAVGLLGGMSASATSLASSSQKAATVSFEELDLNTQKGVDVLYARLRIAAKDVCAPLAGRELSRQAKYRACINESLDQAVQEVANANLTAAHAAAKQARA